MRKKSKWIIFLDQQDFFFTLWLFLWLKKVSILQFKIKTFSTHTLNLNVCLKFCLSSFMRTLSRSMSLSGRASVCYINDRGFEEKIYSVSKYHNDHTFTWPRETTTGYSNKTKNTESEQVQKFTIQMYNCYSKWTEIKPDWEKLKLKLLCEMFLKSFFHWAGLDHK